MLFPILQVNSHPQLSHSCPSQRIQALAGHSLHSFPVVISTVFISLASVVQSLSCVQLFVTPWTVASQAPLSVGSHRQVYLSAGHKRKHKVSLNFKTHTHKLAQIRCGVGSSSGLSLSWPKAVEQWGLRAAHLYSLEILRNLQARKSSL